MGSFCLGLANGLDCIGCTSDTPCKSGEGICSGTFHQEEPGVYDIWFNTCSEDLCNTMDPNSDSSGGGGNGGGGGNNGGVIFVPPENSANNYRPSGFLAAMLVFVVTLAGFKNKGLL